MALKGVQLPIRNKENLQQINPVKPKPRTLNSKEDSRKIAVSENLVNEVGEVVSVSKDQVEVDIVDSQILVKEDNLS